MKQLRDMTEPELQELMNTLAGWIESVCEVQQVEKPLFTLLLFNDPQIAQYVCNCDRADVIRAMRETADRLERGMIEERVMFPDGKGLGATGDYPEGKLHQHDQGGLNFAVGSDKKIGKVVVQFGKPVAWLGMNAKTAHEFADCLRNHANKIGV